MSLLLVTEEGQHRPRPLSYHESPLSLLFGTNNELLLAHILAYGNGVLTTLESRQLVGPLGSLFGFDEEVDQLFACNGNQE